MGQETRIEKQEPQTVAKAKPGEPGIPEEQLDAIAGGFNPQPEPPKNRISSGAQQGRVRGRSFAKLGGG